MVSDSQRELTEIYQEKTYDELTEILNDWLEGKGDEKDDTKSGESVTSDKVAETTKTVESVSSAFDELFNQNA